MTSTDLNTYDSILDLLFEETDPLLPEINTGYENNSWDILSDILPDDVFKDLTQEDFNASLINSDAENLSPSGLHSDFESSSSVLTVNSDTSSSDLTAVISNKSEFLTTTIPSEKGVLEVALPSVVECNVYVDINSEQNLEQNAQPDSIIIYPILYEEEVMTCNEIANSPEDGCREVHLTPEERKLLEREGVPMPTHYPLTKEEEKNLKKIRRKIRNKVSAQDSRKRKKEYIDGLESRVKFCSTQNEQLQKKVKQLETQNRSLISELKKLQTALQNYGNKNVQTSTCLLILVLSFALFVTPNIWSNETNSNTALLPSSSGPSRTLLSVIPSEVPVTQKLTTPTNQQDRKRVNDFERSLLSNEMVALKGKNSSTQNVPSEMIVNAPQFL